MTCYSSFNTLSQFVPGKYITSAYNYFDIVLSFFVQPSFSFFSQHLPMVNSSWLILQLFANLHGGLRKARRDRLLQCFNKETRDIINIPQDKKVRIEKEAKNEGLFQGQEALKSTLRGK